jgi:hypothetical protein
MADKCYKYAYGNFKMQKKKLIDMKIEREKLRSLDCCNGQK